jgi:DNA-binding transcriptional regulator YiaG
MATNTTGTAELIDMGERRDTLGRVVTPKVRRLELVNAWRTSGLTQAAFAKREGLRYSTFAHWAQQATKPTPAVRSPRANLPRPVSFAEVALPPTLAPALEVRLPDGTVLRGGSAEALAKLVRALRS